MKTKVLGRLAAVVTRIRSRMPSRVLDLGELSPDPTYPTIVYRRRDLRGHTVTVERCDEETALAQWNIPDRRSLVGRLAVVERSDGYLGKVCHLEGRDCAWPGVSVEEIAAATASTYGARYVPGGAR